MPWLLWVFFFFLESRDLLGEWPQPLNLSLRGFPAVQLACQMGLHFLKVFHLMPSCWRLPFGLPLLCCPMYNLCILQSPAQTGLPSIGPLGIYLHLGDFSLRFCCTLPVFDFENISDTELCTLVSMRTLFCRVVCPPMWYLPSLAFFAMSGVRWIFATWMTA